MRRAIRRFHLELLALVLAFLARDSAPAVGVEICGNGVNDDPLEDSLLDEGCNPERHLLVREAPLPRSAIGIVAPVTGQQIWTEPADFNIAVPYGPRLRFQRSYSSQLTAPDDQVQNPLGNGWTHNYMTWIFASNPTAATAIVRLPGATEVNFQFSEEVAGWRYYTPQAGYHVDYLRSDKTTFWELRTLDGTVYKYRHAMNGPLYLGAAYIETISDPLGNSLFVRLGTNKEVIEVKDATQTKKLLFSYATASPYKLTQVDYEADGIVRASLTLPNSLTPTTASLGGAVFRTYHYLSGKLDKVSDNSGHTITEFQYLTGGKTARVHSGDGVVGYTYGATCAGGAGVYQFFNLKDDGGGNEGVACDTNAQCNTGYYCGGQTTPGQGMSGLCFRAQRCVVTTSAADDLVWGVTSECSTCVDVADRSWDTTALTLRGMQDSEQDLANRWTSYLYNGDGLVTTVVENDDNDIAGDTNPTDARTTWFFYGNTNFPGLVTEVRRKSELGSGSCSDTATTGCKRTIYTYTTGGQIDTIQEIGFTYSINGNPVSYSFTTDYDYDPQGRLTQVNGPRTDTSYDIVQYTYWSGAGNLQNDYLKEVKRQKDDGTFITTTYDGYDYWGNAGKVVDPNSKLTCLTYDANRNVLNTRRIAMAGQTTCTADASDLVTTNTYDSALNLTKVQYPEGNCTHYEYDSRARLSKVKSRDDCNAASSGDNQEFTYDDNGNLIKTEFKDATGAVTKRQEKTFAADGRVAEILNPANTAKKKTLAYKIDGMLESITGEDGIGKTEWAYDNFNRTDAEKRYKTSSTFDTWDLTPGVQLDLPTKVQDDDTKHIDWVWDDMGRKVKQVTPDAGTTILVYDEAGNVTGRVDGLGTANEKTHHFGFDSLNRPEWENWGDPTCFTLGGSEIHHFYDVPVNCPVGTCVNSIGRPAKVRVQIRCDDNQNDDTYDQWTYWGYDDAGRVVQESIRDDGGRIADQYYSWDKNGNITKTTAPSAYYQKSVLGSAGNNSDRDKLVEADRGTGGTDTVLTDSGKWYPFGPIKEYRQSNTISGNKIMARLTWDLAHRPSNILYERETNGTDIFRIAYTLDAQGRVTIRDFTGGHASLQDAYYTYDWQNRVTCDSGASGACPTSGASMKTNINSSPPYSASSDRRSIKHKNGTAWPLDTFTYTLATGKDQISSISKSNGQTISFGWDTRGNRLYDDDAQFTDDRRDYVYDARDNAISVSGKMKISDTVVHNYTESNAFDHKNRRVFKSLLDTTAVPNVESQYFYYYDLQDRLIEVKYTPNITDSSTYQIWQLYWIGSRPVAWFQTTYPTPTTTRRFIHTDDLGTPLELYTWPTSGNSVREWAINPDAFGWGNIVLGATVYEPLRFPGQMCDEETTSVYFDTVTSTYKGLRPPLSDNRYRVYDPSTASYLQSDPLVASTWNSYAYAENNPVMVTDPTGLGVFGDLWDALKGGATTLWHSPERVDWECVACSAMILGAGALVAAECGTTASGQVQLTPACLAAIDAWVEVTDSCDVACGVAARACPEGMKVKENLIGIGWHCEPVEDNSLFSWREDHAFEGSGNYFGFDPHEGTRPDPGECRRIANSSSCPQQSAATGPRVAPMDQYLYPGP